MNMKIKAKRLADTVVIGLTIFQKNHAIPQNDNETENGTFSHLWSHGNDPCPGDVYIAGGQHMHSGLHPGGKEFSLLRSKNPICETAGWIAIL
jgi:hypothetical protein